MRFNLILSVFWLALGGAMLGYRVLHPEIDGQPAGNFTLYGGAAAVVLSLYNFVRWWAARTFARRQEKSPPPARRRPTLEYHPEFDFTRQGPQTLKTDEEPPEG